MIGAFPVARPDTTHTRIAAPLACVALACLGAAACASGAAPGPTATEGSASPSASGLDLVDPEIAMSALSELPASGSAITAPAPSSAASGAPTAVGSSRPAASAAPSANTATKPDLASWLPAHEAACTTDADCAVTQTGAGERFTCCDACGVVAGTKAWVAKVDRACSARRTKPGIGPCPPRDCGPSAARCVAGACALR